MAGITVDQIDNMVHLRPYNSLRVIFLIGMTFIAACNSEEDPIDITGTWSKQPCMPDEVDSEDWVFDNGMVYPQLYETLFLSNTCQAWPSVNSLYLYDEEEQIIDFVALDTSVRSQTPVRIRWLIDSLSIDYMRYFLINRNTGAVDWKRRELFKG